MAGREEMVRQDSFPRTITTKKIAVTIRIGLYAGLDLASGGFPPEAALTEMILHTDLTLEILEIILRGRILSRMCQTELSQLIDAFKQVPLPPYELAPVMTGMPEEKKKKLLCSLDCASDPLMQLRKEARAITYDKMWIPLSGQANTSTSWKATACKEAVEYILQIEHWIIRELQIMPLLIVTNEIRILFRYRRLIHHTPEALELIQSREPSTDLARAFVRTFRNYGDCEEVRRELREIIFILGLERPEIFDGYPVLREYADRWIYAFRDALFIALHNYPVEKQAVLELLPPTILD
jgi:hypothetical protein